MVTLASIEALMTAAIAALDAGDYSTALRKAIAAQGRLSLVPDTERGEGSGGSGGATQSIKFMRQSIGDFITNLRKHGNAALGIQIENVTLDPLSDLGIETHGGTELGEL